MSLDRDVLAFLELLGYRGEISGDEEVDYLFQVIQDQIGVPGILVAANMPRIKADNPKLYRKLNEIGMSEDPNEMKIDLADTMGKY